MNFLYSPSSLKFFDLYYKKVLSVKRSDMRKLVAAGICLLSLSLSVTTGRRCNIKEARMRTGKKCCEEQLWMVDKALSRAGDIPEGSWICLSHRNLILAEDKRCSCPSSWGHRNSVTEYKSGTNWCNKCSILVDKEFAAYRMFTPRKQKRSDIRK